MEVNADPALIGGNCYDFFVGEIGAFLNRGYDFWFKNQA